MAKKRKKRIQKKKAPERKSIVRRALPLFILATVLGSGIGFYYVDHKVSLLLNRRGDTQRSLILSDLFQIHEGFTLSSEQFLNQLKRRSYRPVESNPENPGEYFQQGSILTIKTHSFIDSTGSLRPDKSIAVDLETKEIYDKELGDHTTLELEPEPLGRLGGGAIKAKQFVALEDIPVSIQQAITSIEDERFYSHAGIDLIGIARASIANLKAMGIVQGGSTITQQLAKNLLFTPRRTIGRKILEALAALSLEVRLNKREILEMYLNEVYLGQEGSVAIHGVAEAASAFFGKEVKDVTLSEAALLAGVIQAPSRYSPQRHLTRALDRRDTVLNKMHELRLISDSALRDALDEKISVAAGKSYRRKAPYFIAALEKELEEKLYLDAAIAAGISVYTGILPDMQSCAESAVSSGLMEIEKSRPALGKGSKKLQVGLLALEPSTGKIRAWVGGRSFGAEQFDHVNQAQRQVGSTVKPFLYLTALDPSLNQYRTATPISLISDRPLSVDLPTKTRWEPENYDKKFRGDVTFRYALEHSLNTPAVYIGQRVGIEALLRTVHGFGLGYDWPAVPSLALGSGDTSLLTLTTAYAGLANGGVSVNTSLYSSVLDRSGVTLLERELLRHRVADENAVFVLTDILQGVIERGTGQVVRRLGYIGPVAGKTGTSNDTRDSWFLGFTPTLTAGVWVGFDDNSKTGLTGASGAGPIWAHFMKCAQPFHEAANFTPPGGVVFLEIDGVSGGLATPQCPSGNIVREVFVRGTQPQRPCPLHLRYDEGDMEPQRDNTLDERSPRPRRRSFFDILFGR
ncbi:MAG: PBP1A family penicillin-binding protein [Bdellovibrionales bacterium]|nr:PBP1A family penicillin-binding protein [Bdellovibrionales bacterium]